MLKGNKTLGIVMLVALLCALAVFVIEDFRYKGTEASFPEAPKLTEGALDINTASIDELKTLDGIGESMAEKILNFRETVRPFETVQDLTLIKGFGEKKLEKILDSIYVKR